MSENTLSGKSCWIDVKAFQEFISINLQDRTYSKVMCRDLLTVKQARRLIRHLELAISEVEDTDGTDDK